MVFRIIAAVVILISCLGAWKCSAASLAKTDLDVEEIIESAPSGAGRREDPNRKLLEELDVVRPHYIKQR